MHSSTEGSSSEKVIQRARRCYVRTL